MLLSERRYEAAIKQIDERRLQHSEEKGEAGWHEMNIQSKSNIRTFEKE